MCRLEYRESTESRNRAVFLVEVDYKREWMVHCFKFWDNPVAESAFYDRSIEVEGSWQIRLYEQLVRDGRAQNLELD